MAKKKKKHKAYRPKGTGIGKLVGTRVPKDVMKRLEARNININKAIRDFLVTLSGGSQ